MSTPFEETDEQESNFEEPYDTDEYKIPVKNPKVNKTNKKVNTS